jgi:hypothetical protein
MDKNGPNEEHTGLGTLVGNGIVRKNRPSQGSTVAFKMKVVFYSILVVDFG